MAKRDYQLEKTEEPMTSEEARAFRASLYKPTEKVLTEQEKREQFRLFWAANRTKYSKGKDLEPIIWVHLKSAKLDDPKDFEKGLQHFGLKKVK